MALAAALACSSPSAPVVRGAGSVDGSPQEPEDLGAAVGIGLAESESLAPLAEIFYSRLTNRRFSSIATYYDPALREFFSSPEAFADYFADLVDALTDAHFRAERPTRAVLEQIEEEGLNRVKVTVRFEGDNSLPLRWWKVKLVREDRWERSQGRWWILPGKL